MPLIETKFCKKAIFWYNYIKMDNTKDILMNKRFKEIIDNLSSETLRLIAEDEMKALEAAKKGIEKVEPERIDDVRYLQDVANGMQKLAQVVLAERQKK